MNEEYPLMLEHVKQFLATKEDDDEIGICYNSMFCPLSETLNWLYPEVGPWRVDTLDYGAAKGVGYYDLSRDMLSLRTAFDRKRNDRGIITKAKFREHLEYLSLHEQEEHFKIPFPISALFEETAKA